MTNFLIINMIGGTERHLPGQHGSCRRAHRELTVRKRRRSFRLNTVAFFSGRVEKTNIVNAAGARVEEGG